jgi:trigger factor
VFPEFTVAGFDSITVERLSAEWLMPTWTRCWTSCASRTPVSKWRARCAERRPVNIDFVGKVDGEAFAGGSAKGTQLVLGSGRMIPGFEDGLVGAKAGEERVLNLTFPEDYQNLDLAGKTAEFTVTVNSVSEPSCQS